MQGGKIDTDIQPSPDRGRFSVHLFCYDVPAGERDAHTDDYVRSSSVSSPEAVDVIEDAVKSRDSSPRI